MSNPTLFSLIPLSPTLGARISGLDLAQSLSAETIADIRQALLKHEVLFFENQNLTPHQQRDFAARFGELHLHPIRPSIPGTPEVLCSITNRPAIRIPEHGGRMSRSSKHPPWVRCCTPGM